MTARMRRHEGRLRDSTVARVERITPAMTRIRLVGDLDDWQDNGTDQHLAFYFLRPDAVLPSPLPPDHVYAHWLELLPRLRRYTVRRTGCEPENWVDIDLVCHGDSGPASHFAETAVIGDRVVWFGPTAAYEPGDGDWHLLVADETGLPGLGAIADELPAGTTVVALAEIPDPDGRQDDLVSAADLDLRWLSRDGRPAGRGTELVDAVRGLILPPGRGRVWAAGERGRIREIRRHLLAAGVERGDLHATAYWDVDAAQDARAERRDRENAERMWRERAAGRPASARDPGETDEHDEHEHEHEHEHDEHEHAAGERGAP